MNDYIDINNRKELAEKWFAINKCSRNYLLSIWGNVKGKYCNIVTNIEWYSESKTLDEFYNETFIHYDQNELKYLSWLFALIYTEATTEFKAQSLSEMPKHLQLF